MLSFFERFMSFFKKLIQRVNLLGLSLNSWNTFFRLNFFDVYSGKVKIGKGTRMPILNYSHGVVQIEKGGLLDVGQTLVMGKPQVKGSQMETRLKIESGGSMIVTSSFEMLAGSYILIKGGGS